MSAKTLHAQAMQSGQCIWREAPPRAAAIARDIARLGGVEVEVREYHRRMDSQTCRTVRAGEPGFDFFNREVIVTRATI